MLTKPMSVYIHWPFCARRCTYCNFNKYVPRGGIDDNLHQRMKSCILTETKTLLEMSGTNRVVSVFFGGGTPSLMQPSLVEEVLNVIDRISSTRSIEVSLEANPVDLDDEKLSGFVTAGINRLSIGIQSMNNADLRLLNRDHSAAQGRTCIENSVKLLGPESVSVDLIFGRPFQSVEAWNKELDDILQYSLSHISLYQLTVERGTKLWKDIQAEKLSVPSEETTSTMYELAVETLRQRNLQRYEVSNFASPGCESVHNSWYWTGGEYLGIGPGAHGRWVPRNARDPSEIAANRIASRIAKVATGTGNGRQARVQTLEPEAWMKEVEKCGHGTRSVHRLSSYEVMAELVASGLRTREGILSERWQQVLEENGLKGPSIRDLMASGEMLKNWMEESFVVWNDRGLRMEDKGINILDHILPDFLVALRTALDDNHSTR